MFLNTNICQLNSISFFLFYNCETLIFADDTPVTVESYSQSELEENVNIQRNLNCGFVKIN